MKCFHKMPQEASSACFEDDGETKAQDKLWLFTFLFSGNLSAGTSTFPQDEGSFWQVAFGSLAIVQTNSWGTLSSYSTISTQVHSHRHRLGKLRGTDTGLHFHYVLGTSSSSFLGSKIRTSTIWEGGLSVMCFPERSGDGWWWWLPNDVNVLNATELYIENWWRW